MLLFLFSGRGIYAPLHSHSGEIEFEVVEILIVEYLEWCGALWRIFVEEKVLLNELIGVNERVFKRLERELYFFFLLYRSSFWESLKFC